MKFYEHLENKHMYLPALHKRDPKLMEEGSECDTGSDLSLRDCTVH